MHNINFTVYPEKVNKTLVQTEWDNIVRHEDYGEGASGLPGQIKWNDRTFDSEAEAKAWIESHDNGWYDQLAVKFKEIPANKLKTTKKYEELVAKAQSLCEELRKKNSIAYATTVKSEYVGCKNCGSRIASKYIQKTNFCPICRADLRSPSTLDSLKRLKERVDEANKKADAERKNLEAKQAKSAEVKWLVKTEYHT